MRVGDDDGDDVCDRLFVRVSEDDDVCDRLLVR